MGFLITLFNFSRPPPPPSLLLSLSLPCWINNSTTYPIIVSIFFALHCFCLLYFYKYWFQAFSFSVLHFPFVPFLFTDGFSLFYESIKLENLNWKARKVYILFGSKESIYIKSWKPFYYSTPLGFSYSRRNRSSDFNLFWVFYSNSYQRSNFEKCGGDGGVLGVCYWSKLWLAMAMASAAGIQSLFLLLLRPVLVGYWVR